MNPLRFPARSRTLGAAVSLSLVTFSVTATAAEAGPVGPRRSVPAQVEVLAPSDPTVDLGLGYLGYAERRAANLDQRRRGVSGLRWLAWASLPLYSLPDESALWGLLDRGWLMPRQGDGLPLDELYAAVVEIDWESAAFPVYEMKPGGWFRFGQLGPGACGDGTSWARLEDLSASPLPLVVEPWERLLVSVPGPLHLRALGNGVELLAEPRSEAPSVARITRSHEIEPLEVLGSWIKVQVTQPAVSCGASPEGFATATTTTGWLRWRDTRQGTRLWFPIKGC
jgi:hypothetical protein